MEPTRDPQTTLDDMQIGAVMLCLGLAFENNDDDRIAEARAALLRKGIRVMRIKPKRIPRKGRATLNDPTKETT